MKFVGELKERGESPDIQEVLDERGSAYGDYSRVCEITEIMRKALMRGAGWDGLDDAAKVGIFFICNKLARAVNGKLTQDTLVDIQGYAKLIEIKSTSVVK